MVNYFSSFKVALIFSLAFFVSSSLPRGKIGSLDASILASRESKSSVSFSGLRLSRILDR